MNIVDLDIEPLGLTYNKNRPLLIAGPCSAETEEQVLSTAHKLSSYGIKIFRAGVWKPRTRPGCFEGVGEEALKWLKRVKQETGMLVSTEVATPKHVELSLKYDIDIFWIGARTTANPFAIQALADALKGDNKHPILVKNPVNPDLELWIGALQRLNRFGIKRLGAIHRGFSSYGSKVYRNPPMWQIPIELHHRIPKLPIICDPSHMGGHRNLISSICQYGMDLGYNGLIVETHCNPDKAWSDAKQQISPEELIDILKSLVVRNTTNARIDLTSLRSQIDEIDDNIISLLRKRFNLCQDIGKLKREHNMAVLQANRYKENFERYALKANMCNIDKDFLNHIFELIHEESVRQQLSIINEDI